jgi:zinc protease
MTSRRGPSSDPLVLERSETPEGLRVIRQSPPAGSATFAASFLAAAGWAFDPETRSGLAMLASRLVTSGAGAHNRLSLAKLLDRYGATLTSQAAPESAEVTLWGPAAHWRTLLPLLGDAILRPRFAADDLERARRQLLERQLREATQPEARAEKELWEAVYPKRHPYRETGFGTARSVRRIARADLIRFRREHFTPDGASLVFTLGESLETLTRAAREVFRGWERTRGPPQPAMPAPLEPNGRIRRVNLPGRSQVEVRVGGPSVARADPRYPAVALANELLGGRPLLSRLFQRVRERHGLAYHASSDLEAMRWGGYWLAEAGTGPGSAERVASMLRREASGLARESPSSRELDRIRESAIGSIPLQLETTLGAHELALDVAYHDLPLDYYRAWPDVLRGLSPAEVRDAAAAGLAVDGAATVLAGPLYRGGREPS